MTGSFAKGGNQTSTKQNGICRTSACTCTSFEECAPSANVSCDGTGLPARSSNWTPVTSLTRNFSCEHDVVELGSWPDWQPQLNARE